MHGVATSVTTPSLQASVVLYVNRSHAPPCIRPIKFYYSHVCRLGVANFECTNQAAHTQVRGVVGQESHVKQIALELAPDGHVAERQPRRCVPAAVSSKGAAARLRQCQREL